MVGVVETEEKKCSHKGTKISTVVSIYINEHDKNYLSKNK